jgi:hypothetical protein
MTDKNMDSEREWEGGWVKVEGKSKKKIDMTCAWAQPLFTSRQSFDGIPALCGFLITISLL